jgi:hypothetical protein
MWKKPRPAVPSLRQAQSAGNISVVDVDQQLLIESAIGDSLPDIHLPDVLLPDVLHLDDPLPEACPDGWVGVE